MMGPSRERYYRTLFWVAATYDIVLGIVFTLFSAWAFDLLGIRDELPGGGYIPLLGSFFFVIGVAYVLIARGDLRRNRDLIVIGTLYKLAYSSIAFIFWAIGSIPHVAFAAVFGIADGAFFVLMLGCLVYMSKTRGTGAEPWATGP